MRAGEGHVLQNLPIGKALLLKNTLITYNRKINAKS